MAERLGEALLEIRTNDAGFTSGVEQARGKAQQLGAQLDRTKGSSSQLAAEMVTTGRSAAQMGQGFERAGQQVTASAGAQRAGMQQLSFQLGDIATMYSLGARPAQIFASQIGQVTQAVQLMSGGTSRVAAFLGGPWGIALTAATIVLAPFVGKLFEAEEALGQVELASDRLGEAQDVLGRIFDLTTGKLKDQSDQARETARSLALLQQLEAVDRENKIRAELETSAGRSIAMGEYVDDGSRGGRSFRTTNVPTVSAAAARRALDGDPDGALAQLRADLVAGRTTPEIYRQVAGQIQNLKTEIGNISRNSTMLESIANGQLDPSLMVPETPGRQRRGRQGPRQRSDAERQDDFAGRSFDIERQQLQARLALTTSAQERADLQRDLLGLEREQRIAQIRTLDLSQAQKDALVAQVEALLGTAPKFDEQGNLIVSANRGLEGEIIARELAVRQLQQSQQLADIRFEGETEALRNMLALADTEAERKAVALRLLEAEEEFERIRLQTIIDAAARGEAEAEAAELARAQLANLEANAAGRRAATARQNETEAERYLRNVNATSGQINEALDGIRIDGLESLNDGLTRAIMGAESLGDVFSRVADQIIADLLRIAIQQAIIRPLANSLFGGGGGGGGFLGSLFGGGGGPQASLLGSVNSLFSGGFAGLFAKGGTIPTGQFGIVGEEGPEIAMAGPGGLGILSNSQSRALMGGGMGGTSVTVPISIDATGADAAALARVRAEIEQLRAELPGTIITTVRDAQDRRFLP